MIDIDKGSEQLDKADGFLTKLKTLLKKHWGILMIIGLGAGGYYLISGDEMPVDDEVGYEDEYYDDTLSYEEDYSLEEDSLDYEDETY